VLDDLARAGRVATVQGDVRLADHAPRLTERQQALANDLREHIVAAGSEPPSLEELASILGRPPEELAAICRVLTREGELIAVEANRHYSPTSVIHLTSLLSTGMTSGVDYGPAELRDLLGVTRKFLIPFLEYCDREGYTIRNELGRRKRGTKLAVA
jgi:selenocysteine-specific elongation factor